MHVYMQLVTVHACIYATRDYTIYPKMYRLGGDLNSVVC